MSNSMVAKKRVIIIIAVMLGLLVVFAALLAILEGIENGEKNGKYEPEAIDPALLHGTKDEEFDIMEYPEYLKYDRSIYYTDQYSGITVSVDESDVPDYGKGFEVVYKLLIAINEGDCDAYNDLVGSRELEKDGFTQQQIYGIKVVKQSEGVAEYNGKTCNEHIFKVTYKIHENNGTYRDTIMSDASRPQYFVVNDSTGEYLLMEIIEQGYNKK